MYCSNCGQEINDNADVCIHCGCAVKKDKPAAQKDDSLGLVAKIFLIIGCVAQGWLLLPLAWCLPITLSVCGKMKRGEPIGTGLKVCALLFVNLISGIILLCRSED